MSACHSSDPTDVMKVFICDNVNFSPKPFPL